MRAVLRGTAPGRATDHLAISVVTGGPGEEAELHETRYDGKWVLQTNFTKEELSTEEIALRYKDLWMVEDVFRSLKSVLRTRPVWHQCDETIRGHVFSSFLALVLLKELLGRLEESSTDQKLPKIEWGRLKRVGPRAESFTPPPFALRWILGPGLTKYGLAQE